MERKKFLQNLGLGSLAILAPNLSKAAQIAVSAEEEDISQADCVLIPSETAGPFPLDLTENNIFFRQNVIEDRTGIPLNVKLKIKGIDNCGSLQNVRVNIWHCDKDGLYSGYSQTNNPGQAGKTYLRGYQMTDANGIVNFQTIFPGWYVGRICHIHFQVYVSSVYAAVSQLSFDIPTKNAIYTNNASLYSHGVDPMTFQQDNIFNDGYQYQIASLTANSSGGYDCYLEVTIRGSGSTGLGSLEPETGGVFKLGQNFPNPFNVITTIPFEIFEYIKEAYLEIYDLNGKRIKVIQKSNLEIGMHYFEINLQQFGIPTGNYVYQLMVLSTHGTFKQPKMMTHQE